MAVTKTSPTPLIDALKGMLWFY